MIVGLKSAKRLSQSVCCRIGIVLLTDVETQNNPAAVIAISSHVMRGAVGNRVVAFALETMGHPVWSVPTVVLPWHPGQGPSTRMAFPDDLFDKAIDDLMGSPWTGEVRAVISGYFGSARQAEAVARLVTALRQKHPDMLYICDPVLGDDGGLYVPQATAEAIRDHLIPIASIATPNRFELGWLSGNSLSTNNDIVSAVEALGLNRCVVTSAFAFMGDSVANLLVIDKKAIMAEHRKIGSSHSGTGDLFAATFLGRILSGASEERALQLASSTVFEIVARSVKKGADGLLMAEEADSLRNPMAMVQMRKLHNRTAR